jgi:hypothetical protein
MSDDREKLSQTEELENDENDVEAHILGEDGGKNAFGEDGGKNVLGEDGERGRLSE